MAAPLAVSEVLIARAAFRVQSTPMPPIYIVNGAPAVGKSTLSRALMARYPQGVHVPVDDLREWVVSGIAHPLDWNEETVRQFRLAEESALDIALRYQDAGFAVAVDHCRRLKAWDEVLDRRAAGRPIVRAVIHCEPERNLARNRARTNKDFDPAELETIICELSVHLPASAASSPHWALISNDGEGIDAAVEKLYALGEAVNAASRTVTPRG